MSVLSEPMTPVEQQSTPVAPATEQSAAPAQKPVDISANSPLECNICYEESSEPVTTVCGHIYCWSCVYKWISTKSGNNYCPVCKNAVTEDKIIPLYPKNYDDNKKIQTNEEGVPKRPLVKRDERSSAYNGFANTLLTGINIRGANYGLTIGCLPAFIPFLLFIFMTLFAMFTDDDDSDYAGDATPRSYVEQRQSEYLNGEQYQTDEFDWMIIVIMIIFISIPFILGKLRRRNY